MNADATSHWWICANRVLKLERHRGQIWATLQNFFHLYNIFNPWDGINRYLVVFAGSVSKRVSSPRVNASYKPEAQNT
jgi:hypothetical protein